MHDHFAERSLALGILVLFSSSCTPPESSNGSANGIAEDLAEWNALVAEYDGRRTEFLGPNVQDLTAVGNRLYWYDNSKFDFRLRSHDDTTGTQIDYSFSVGQGDLYNHRASDQLLVTANATASPVVYHAYDPGSPELLIGTTAMPPPPSARWTAYAVDGSTVYFVDTTVVGSTTLFTWVPGSNAPPSVVTTLESAGAEIGEFREFGIWGDRMVFIETGRIWRLDLATNQATWLQNETEVTGSVDFRDDGVLFGSASDLMFYDYGSQELISVSDRIDANPFEINSTFAQAAEYSEPDFARWKNHVLYVGQAGLFAYDLVDDEITPLLLSPNTKGLRIDYRYPVALENGAAFVTGLTSTSGAVGADGPTFRIDVASLL